MTQAPAGKVTHNSGAKLGTFGGVFTPSILTILGAILFMRANFVTGEAGVFGAVLILLLATAISVTSALSASAVATNIQVRGGGAYFLISRVLGPEFGGSIGVVFFIAQALSVPFYILGFTEALVSGIPALEPHRLLIALLAALALFVVAWIGAGWAIKTQYVIMGVLGLSILVFMAGMIMNFDAALFNANLKAAYTTRLGGGTHSFWTVFAIFFPAVTGFLAGVNMSGDLKEPSRSIPRGTFLAIGAGFVVYLAMIFLSGGAFSRESMIANPYGVLTENALWGMGFLVAAGVIAATLSSALGSYLGAPRILQAVARDRLLRPLSGFAKGAPGSDEPRRALILTVMITIGTIIWAERLAGGNAFNVVAAVITMFFLYTYGMLNLAAFTEAFGRNPSFRPTFRLFHWSTAALGTLACIAVAFLIDMIPALIAVVVVAFLYWYLRRKGLNSAFGDARRGFLYSRVRSGLLGLREVKEDARNWRPTIVAFSGNPNTREDLVAWSIWLEAGRGLVQLVNVIKGDPFTQTKAHSLATNQLETYLRGNHIQAFPLVQVAEDVEHGIAGALQLSRIGPIKPNLALFGWNAHPEAIQPFLKYLRIADDMGMSLVLVNAQPVELSKKRKRIDVWWRGRQNGSLMVLLAHLISLNWEWAHARIRVLREVESGEGVVPARQALRELIEQARLDAEAVVYSSTQPFTEILHAHSADADCVFLGFALPDEAGAQGWHRHYCEMLKGLPTVILVDAQTEGDLLQ